MVMPILLLLTVGFIFIGLYFMERSSAYGVASLMSERAAYLWDNSYRSVWNGAYPDGRHDGLYWRIREDNVGNLVRNELPERKMGRTAVLPEERWQTRLHYSNVLVKRTVTAEAESGLRSGWFAAFLGRSSAAGRSESTVVDPAELIRSVRLLERYAPEWKESRAPAEPTQISSWEADMPEKPPPAELLEFRKEIEARAYLQRQTGGRETYMKLDDGRRRLIDALDADGIAHQAYIGYVPNRFTTTPDGEKVNEQLDKDLALLRSGRVKAVVWHFYRKSGEERVGPTRPLMRELERQGVIIVIHDQEYVEVNSS